MKFKQLSLRVRIFLSMILLVFVASVLIAAVTIYQYKDQTKEYNVARLEHKEESVLAAINYWLNNGNTFPLETKYLQYIFKDKIYEIADIEKLEINIYNLEGKLLISSHSGFVENSIPTVLNDSILIGLENNLKHRIANTKEIEGSNFQTSYVYLNDNKFKPIGILNLQYIQDNSIQTEDLREFLYRLLYVYILMFATAIVLAYFLSSYITKTINEVTKKMKITGLNKPNEKIILKEASSEMYTLVNAYNTMIDKLEDSATKLAKSERELAWREMAKQVAHEIKNPLTPMRLTVQSFQQKFNPSDPKINDKLNEYSKTLIQQIDIMSSIASAFSDFAKMPTQNREKMNVVEVVKTAMDIFSEDYILYYPEKQVITAELDKIQLVRIITNLIKNSIQAMEEIPNKKLEITVLDKGEFIEIDVADNGKGIAEEDKEKVFEPKFTTKTSGMGLGLPMVKNIIEAYNGTISFNSNLNNGTTFKIIIPKK